MAIRYAPGIYSIRNTAPAGKTEATVIIDNERSIKLLERAGFKKEGLLEKYEVAEGQHKDYYIYGRVVE